MCACVSVYMCHSGVYHCVCVSACVHVTVNVSLCVHVSLCVMLCISLHVFVHVSLYVRVFHFCVCMFHFVCASVTLCEA